MEWTKQAYNAQYEKWVPWLEDQYLRWFTKDNKVSYTAKGTFPSLSLLLPLSNPYPLSPRTSSNLNK